MQLTFTNVKQSTVQIGRTLGYVFLGMTENNEFNFARPVANAYYPRYHMYVKEDGMAITVNLHLDQKKPSYEGSTAHSGEYSGPLIEQEAERIKQLITNNP